MRQEKIISGQHYLKAFAALFAISFLFAFLPASSAESEWDRFSEQQILLIEDPAENPEDAPQDHSPECEEDPDCMEDEYCDTEAGECSPLDCPDNYIALNHTCVLNIPKQIVVINWGNVALFLVGILVLILLFFFFFGKKEDSMHEEISESPETRHKPEEGQSRPEEHDHKKHEKELEQEKPDKESHDSADAKKKPDIEKKEAAHAPKRSKEQAEKPSSDKLHKKESVKTKEKPSHEAKASAKPSSSALPKEKKKHSSVIESEKPAKKYKKAKKDIDLNKPIFSGKETVSMSSEPDYGYDFEIKNYSDDEDFDEKDTI